MPSTNKTPFLGLNRWQGDDKPKMNDFNTDNQIVDATMRQHVEDAARHLTAVEKAYLGSGPLTTGSYTGNGNTTRMVPLGFRPRFVIVFADTYPLTFWNEGQGDNNGYCAMATNICGTIGIDLTADGFQVYHTNSGVSSYTSSRMNQTGVTYTYAAFR